MQRGACKASQDVTLMWLRMGLDQQTVTLQTLASRVTFFRQSGQDLACRACRLMGHDEALQNLFRVQGLVPTDFAWKASTGA